MKRAKEFAIEFIKNHPEHKSEVIELLKLYQDEIEDGESEHFIQSCEDLLTN